MKNSTTESLWKFRGQLLDLKAKAEKKEITPQAFTAICTTLREQIRDLINNFEHETLDVSKRDVEKLIKTGTITTDDKKTTISVIQT